MLGENMGNQKRIKISKIENDMHAVSCELSRIESLSRILYQILIEDYNLKPQDSQNLAIILKKEIYKAKDKFNKIESILNI